MPRGVFNVLALGKTKVIRTKDSNQGQVLASLRTLAMRLFREADIENFRAALDDFSDNPEYFEVFLRQFGFL